MKKFTTAALAVLLGASVFLGGCTGGSTVSDVKTTVRIANSADKILQSYDTSTTEGEAFKARFEGMLKDTFSIKAYRNEYESAQLILTPDKDVKSYSVSVGDFKNGSAVLPASAFDVRHEYYHEVESIYDFDSEMQPGMYPDALLPMQTAKEYGLNKIEAGENQGVYITVKIPKDQAAGVYTGTISVDLDGKKETVSATVEVIDYTLPDTVSLKSCVPTQIGYFMNGELDDTQEMYEKYADALKEYRLGIHYLSSYYPSGSRTAQENAVYDAKLAVEAAKDVSVPSYAIRVFEKSDPQFTDGYVLNEEYFLIYLKAYVDVSMEYNVNLFEKAYVYMGNIIDEPDVGMFWDRANYACRQFDNVVAQAVSYAENKGAPAELVEDLKNLDNIVTGRYSDRLQDVQVYCPTIDVIGDSATVEDYQGLREQSKDYWWYSCTLPKIPYPTVHIDDNGVSSRLMGWMAKEYDVSGYLTWESAYYMDFDTNAATDVKGIDLYDNVHRWTDAYGDGFFFYPGKVFNLDGPVPAMRLFTVRDGMEDYEALNDLENRYAALSEKAGETLNADGALNEIYSRLYSNVKVYCTSQDILDAKDTLSALLLLAQKEVAVSDFVLSPDGTVTAKIYSGGANVTLNGKQLSFENGFCEVSVKGGFVLEADGITCDLGITEMKGTAAFEVSDVKVYDESLNEAADAVTAAEEGVSAVIPAKGRMDLSLSKITFNKDTDSLLIGVWLDGDQKVKSSVAVYGENRSRIIDSVYLHPGYNILRFDRIGDLDWSAMLKGETLIFILDNTQPVTLRVVSMGYTA